MLLLEPGRQSTLSNRYALGTIMPGGKTVATFFFTNMSTIFPIFMPSSLLSEVYAWAECSPYLPENTGHGLVFPKRFVLKTNVPPCELTGMSSSVEALRLAGVNLLLTQVEDEPGGVSKSAEQTHSAWMCLPSVGSWCLQRFHRLAEPTLGSASGAADPTLGSLTVIVLNAS